MVLNRYFLRPEGETVKAGDLYRHARHLRLGECVAASFAFPGGFEPLIFPDDYFRPGRSPAGPAGAERGRQQFSGSLICDRKPYVAFLDGGPYDNLGLASVEDIRSFPAKRWRDLEDRRHCPRDEDRGKEIEREQQIHYVIATDVDNIQPGVGFYTEPSLRHPPAESPGPARRKGPLAWLRQGRGLLRGVVGLGVLAPYVRDLLARFHDPVLHAAAGPLERDRRMALPLKLLELDADLKHAIEQLNLLEAASVWTWLTASLELDGKVSDLGVPHPTIGRLVADVHRLLRGAMQEANRLQPSVAEPQIRQRCAVKLSDDATCYSSIPLICEMATNLNTKLWVKGYRWYLPNASDDNRIVVCGGWSVQQPPGNEDRPLLDLGALPQPSPPWRATSAPASTSSTSSTP